MNCLKRTFFNYQSPSNLYKKLSETENAEKSKTKSDLIKKVLTKSKKTIKKAPRYDVLKTEDNEKIIDFVEKILELNNNIQLGQGLKILIPNQMLSRLPAQFI